MQSALLAIVNPSVRLSVRLYVLCVVLTALHDQLASVDRHAFADFLRCFCDIKVNWLL